MTMRSAIYLLALGCSVPAWLPAQPPPLPPASQALLERARAANPQRYQYAIDSGASVLPTEDGRSFYVLWYPAGAARQNQPLIVTLHGSTSWAFDEFFLWREQAASYGYGILALQWWFGAGEGPEAYYATEDLHRELSSALRRQENREGTALLHGFSRGGANIYAVAALDRQSGDRFYAMVLANAGGASPDFPPNVAISKGEYGYNVFSGTYWTIFCGGADPNPERDGCPAMHRTSEWVESYGGVTALFIEDRAAGHGGFHQTPAHIRAALDAFRDNLSLRRGALNPSTRWEARRDPQFEITGASIPNVGLVGGEVWLMVGTNQGSRLYRFQGDASSATPEAVPGLTDALQGSGFGVGEVVPREGPDKQPELYVLGLAGPGVNRSAVFRLQTAGGRFVRAPSTPVFEGGPADGQFLGVPDVTETHDGRLRMTYVSRGGDKHNSRTAISVDGGASFSPEFKNPFGDFAVPNPQASDTNVDPAVLRLERGGYLAVTMRAARLFLFTSVDGRTFVPSPTAAIEPPQLAPGSTGLFDPTLVQLPDGRIFMYVTAGSGPGGANSRVVRAELAPLDEQAPSAPVPASVRPRKNPRLRNTGPSAGGAAPPTLAFRSSRLLPVGTHRPEILITSKGEIVLVVVQPEGPPSSIGQVKHKAYRFTADWQPIGEPFVVTRTTEEFGEPADQRATLVNDELVVVYQTLVWRERPPINGGPAEPYAKEQSLMLARFTLDGREILRKPIVAHAADNREENFPDHCLLWRGGYLLVSSGSLGGKLKIRKVDLEGNVLQTAVFQNTEENVPDNIGNSLLSDGNRLWMISATGPHRTAALTITEILPDLTPGRPLIFYEPDREQHFPVGNLLTDNWIFVGYTSRPRSGPTLPEQNPYAPFLKIFSRDFKLLGDLKIGPAGFAGVHPTIARLGNRLFVAWSASVDMGGDRVAPQVHVEEFKISG
jgi:hypothetical protein